MSDGSGNTVTSPTHIANVNPFRYRGYYYDTESGFYYLQSRYYDPTTGRFINADGQINTDSLLGTNLFAYCENNPVNLCDPDGHIGIMTVCFIIGVTALAIDVLSGAAQERTEAMLDDPSFYNIANWATAGLAKSIKGTFAPEKPLSLEHWMDSFVTATLVVSALSRIPIGASRSSVSNVDSRITDALRILDQTGIKPGQTQISQRAVLDKFNTYNHLTASSSYTNINGTLYVSDGHHTMIANVMKYGRLNTGIYMGQAVNDLGVVKNMTWSSLIIMP